MHLMIFYLHTGRFYVQEAQKKRVRKRKVRLLRSEQYLLSLFFKKKVVFFFKPSPLFHKSFTFQVHAFAYRNLKRKGFERER